MNGTLGDAIADTEGLDFTALGDRLLMLVSTGSKRPSPSEVSMPASSMRAMARSCFASKTRQKISNSPL
jgi:hypothetical protein